MRYNTIQGPAYNYRNYHTAALVAPAVATYAFSGIYPTNPWVSGGLIWWGTPSGISPATNVVSGCLYWMPQSWIDTSVPQGPFYVNRRFTEATTGDQPHIQSGGAPQPAVLDSNIAASGYDVIYFPGLATDVRGFDLIDGGGSMNIDGTDNDFTWWGVARFDAYPTTTPVIFAVGAAATNIPQMGIAGWNIGGETNTFVVFKRDGAGSIVQMRAPPNSVSLGEWAVWCVVHSGTQTAVFRNGLQIVSSGQNVGAMSTNIADLGRRAREQDAPFNGAMAEMIVIASGCDSKSIQGITSYLSSRYGIEKEVGTEF